MNVAAITAKTHRITKTDTTTYPDANILIDLNLVDAEMIAFILKVQNYREVNGQEAYCDLVSITGLTEGDNGYNGEYAFPTDLLRVKRIEVKFTTSSVPATIYDASNNTGSEYQDAGDGFSQSSPFVRFERDSIFIRPLPTATVTGGIHIWYEKRQTALTGSDTPTLEPSFHRIYPLLLAKEYSMENPDKYNQLWDMDIDKIKGEIANHYRRKFNYKKEISTQRVSFK